MGAGSGERVKLNDVERLLEQKDVFPHKYEQMYEPPSFSVKELRSVVPQHLFQRSLLKSAFYVLQSSGLVLLLFWLATWLDTLPSLARQLGWALYWWFQGAAFFGFWIIGHECGHNTMTDYKWLNQTVGFVVHSLCLFPYHNWRISHALHHATTAHMDLDQNNMPRTKSEAQASPFVEAVQSSGIYTLGLVLVVLLFGWPVHFLYLVGGRSYPEGQPSLLWPSSPVFQGKDRWKVIRSNVAVLGVAGVLGAVAWHTSMWTVVKYYFIPYLFLNAWLVTVTFLHHTDVYLPHYSGKAWTFTRGALSTVDRDYGWFYNALFHHLTDSHVAHHIFSQMPFYNAIQATPYLKAKLGEHYYCDRTPFWKALYRALRSCRYVEDEGDVLFYR